MSNPTTLSHVQLADKESRTQIDTLDKIKIPTDILPEDVLPETRNYIFKLVKKKRGRLNLDNCCDNVTNPKTKSPERIWLFNGARSIWDSELEHILKDKNRYERARVGRDIVFKDGILMVPSSDVLMLEFLRANIHNVGTRRTGSGKYDFYEYDAKQEQQDRMAKQLFKIEMVGKAKDMDEKAAKKLASYFGISAYDEIGQLKTPAGIKTELMIKADNDPVTFAKYVDSKEVEVAYLVKKGILDAKIDTNTGNGIARWANGKGEICKIPQGRKPYEYLTELAMTNSEDGKQFKAQLEQIVT